MQVKYGKFSYLTTFGFCVVMFDQYALDGMIGFSDDAGEVWQRRRVVSNARIEMELRIVR